MPQVKVIELKGFRQVFGNDENAINRHSTRTYIIHVDGKDIGWGFELDRVLDAMPEYFTIYDIGYSAKHGMSYNKPPFDATYVKPDIKCEAVEDCTTWGQIEKKIKDILLCLEDSPVTEHDEVILERSNAQLDEFHMYGKVLFNI